MTTGNELAAGIERLDLGRVGDVLAATFREATQHLGFLIAQVGGHTDVDDHAEVAATTPLQTRHAA